MRATRGVSCPGGEWRVLVHAIGCLSDAGSLDVVQGARFTRLVISHLEAADESVEAGKVGLSRAFHVVNQHRFREALEILSEALSKINSLDNLTSEHVVLAWSCIGLAREGLGEIIYPMADDVDEYVAAIEEVLSFDNVAVSGMGPDCSTGKREKPQLHLARRDSPALLLWISGAWCEN